MNKITQPSRNNIMTKLIVLLLCLCPFAFGQGQVSGAGNIGCSGSTMTGTAITSGTANNTVVFPDQGFPAWGYVVQLNQTSTITGGAVSFQIAPDITTFVNIPVAQVLNSSTFAQLTNPYTLVASTNQSFLIIANGVSHFQIKLTTALTGSATVTPYITPVCTAPPALALDSSGNLKMNISAQSLGKVLVTPDSVALPANQSVNVNQFGGSAAVTGTGASGSGIPRVTVANDSNVLATQSGNWTARVVGNAGAAMDAAGQNVASPANSLLTGCQFNTTPTTITSGNMSPCQLDSAGNELVNLKTALPAGTNSIGESPNMATATTTNAASGCGITSAASTNSTSCKGSAGNMYGIFIINETSTKYYLRIYNSSSAPTCSSATGFIQSYSIPENTGNGGGFAFSFPVPLGFSTGIGYCITGGSSSTDNTNAATGIFGTILYK